MVSLYAHCASWTELYTGMCQWHVACPLRPHVTASGLTHISPGHTETGQRVLAVISSTNHEEGKTEEERKTYLGGGVRAGGGRGRDKKKKAGIDSCNTFS